MTLLVLTLWIFITFFTGVFAYRIGKNAPRNTIYSEEEKRELIKQKRELENFFNYNGDSQI